MVNIKIKFILTFILINFKINAQLKYNKELNDAFNYLILKIKNNTINNGSKELISLPPINSNKNYNKIKSNTSINSKIPNSVNHKEKGLIVIDTLQKIDNYILKYIKKKYLLNTKMKNFKKDTLEINNTIINYNKLDYDSSKYFNWGYITIICIYVDNSFKNLFFELELQNDIYNLNSFSNSYLYYLKKVNNKWKLISKKFLSCNRRNNNLKPNFKKNAPLIIP